MSSSKASRLVAMEVIPVQWKFLCARICAQGRVSRHAPHPPRPWRQLVCRTPERIQVGRSRPVQYRPGRSHPVQRDTHRGLIAQA